MEGSPLQQAIAALKVKPSIDTDAYEDDTPWAPPMLFLAGPIKHWWTCWGSPEHLAYQRHREYVRSLLIDQGYLTYAPWGALKGTWNPAAQAGNNAFIEASHLMVVLTPDGIPADGTDGEARYAELHDTHLLVWKPRSNVNGRLAAIERLVGPGERWQDS